MNASCCGSAQSCEPSQCAACTAAFERKIDEALARATGEKLADPYPQKFTKEDAATKTVLVPNTSHAFSQLMAAAFANQGLNTVSLPIGRERAIYLGKRYVHNDICFPAQIVIGEALAALESGKYDPDKVAIATGKYIGDWPSLLTTLRYCVKRSTMQAILKFPSSPTMRKTPITFIPVSR